LEIERQHTNGSAVVARIVRIQSAGPVVRIELSSGQEANITVELTHSRYHDLALTVGEEVYVRVKDARVFVAGEYEPDYSI
jgi:molybdopterin-binding protein